MPPRLLTLVALAIASASTARAQEPATELGLRIGIHSQQANGRFAGFAGDSGIESFESYAWANETLCLLSASVREPATTPAVGWFFRGRVVKRTGDEFLVDIEWARLWDQNTRLPNGPKGSMQVTLRTGEPLTLDEVTPAVGGCPVIGARLEAAILPQMRPRRLGGGGGGAGGGSGGAGGGGSGVAAGMGTGSSARGSGGGYGGASGGGGTTGARAGVGSSGDGTAVGGSTRDAAERALSALETYRQQFNAEVWLVHKLPSGVENVQRVTFLFGRMTTKFAFAPVDVVKDGEKATVNVAGSLRYVVPNGTDKLMVQLDRTITKNTSSSGGSVKQIDIPAPRDVVSFEFPWTPTRADANLRPHFDGHTFSVRLRVTPRGQ
jgi:hypothetical protein